MNFGSSLFDTSQLLCPLAFGINLFIVFSQVSFTSQQRNGTCEISLIKLTTDIYALACRDIARFSHREVLI